MELSSAAAAMAVRQVAARTRASRSSVVLAAVCAVVARRAGYRELVLPLVSSNRFERHLASYVGVLAQGAVATVGVAGRSFDELVRHTWTIVLEASRLARYDAARRDAVDELTMHERGLRFNYDPFFDSLVPGSWSGLTAGVGVKPEEIDIALARTELRWRPMPVNGAPLRFSLNQVDGCLRLDAWSGDAGLLPRSELESALLAVERLLVAAAHGDVARRPGARGDRAGAHRRDPGPGTGRLTAGSSVADVQRLVDEAVAPAVARVFASAGGRPLVAHLAATRRRPHARTSARPLHGRPRPPPHRHHPPPLRHLPHRTARPGRPRRLAPAPRHRHRPHPNHK